MITPLNNYFFENDHARAHHDVYEERYDVEAGIIRGEEHKGL